MAKSREAIATQQWALLRDHVRSNEKNLSGIRHDIKELQDAQRMLDQAVLRFRHEIHDRLGKQDQAIALSEQAIRRELSDQRLEGEHEIQKRLDRERHTREGHAKDIQAQLDQINSTTFSSQEIHTSSVHECLATYRLEYRNELNGHRQEGQGFHDQIMARISDLANSLDAKTKTLESSIEEQHKTSKADVQSLREILQTSLNAKVATTFLTPRNSTRARGDSSLFDDDRGQLDSRPEGHGFHDNTMARINELANSLDTKTKSLEMSIEEQQKNCKADVQNLRALIQTSQQAFLTTRVAATVLAPRTSLRTRVADEHCQRSSPSRRR